MFLIPISFVFFFPISSVPRWGRNWLGLLHRRLKVSRSWDYGWFWRFRKSWWGCGWGREGGGFCLPPWPVLLGNTNQRVPRLWNLSLNVVEWGYWYLWRFFSSGGFFFIYFKWLAIFSSQSIVILLIMVAMRDVSTWAFFLKTPTEEKRRTGSHQVSVPHHPKHHQHPSST